jgi:hypothetical protein
MKIFIDMDGLVASYMGDMNNPDFSEGFFYNKKPIYHNIKAIYTIFGDCPMAILSASPHETGIKEKNIWLNEHFPIKERHFIKYPDGCKAQFLIDYAEKHNIPRNEILLIDDDLSILRKVQGAGFQVWHPSTLLIAYYNVKQDITLTKDEYDELIRGHDRYCQLMERLVQQPRKVKEKRKIGFN